LGRGAVYSARPPAKEILMVLLKAARVRLCGSEATMNTRSFFRRHCCFSIPRPAAVTLVALIALAWSSLAFCGEIHDAAMNGDLVKVQALLKGNPDLVSSKDDDGMTPLIWASFMDHKDVAELLLANKADVNAKNRLGATALLYAADKGYADVTELLLAHKADVNLKVPDGSTPLHMAADKGHTEVAKLLLASGANVNAKDNSGATPLHDAINNGQTAMVLFLIANGADVNASKGTGDFGDYPLEIALWPNPDYRPGRDIIKALIAKGGRSPWLSQIKGFDPYTFDGLLVDRNENGEVMVGSIPLFLGTGMAERPWKLPSQDTRSHSGTNFFRWADPKKDNGPIGTILIGDAEGHKTLLEVAPPVYIGNEGIVYSAHISNVQSGGPFIDIVVSGSEGTTKVKAVRGNGTVIGLTQSGSSFRATLGAVTDYEPISVTAYGVGDAKQSTVEFDCIYRSAAGGAVIYQVHP